jgi:hypothetical protein
LIFQILLVILNCEAAKNLGHNERLFGRNERLLGEHSKVVNRQKEQTTETPSHGVFLNNFLRVSVTQWLEFPVCVNTRLHTLSAPSSQSDTKKSEGLIYISPSAHDLFQRFPKYFTRLHAMN